MYCVIDTETNGRKDTRIIEIAIIGIDSKGKVEWEWCSLINPEGNDVGHGLTILKHQIYADDVEGKPLFRDFAGHISNLLSGRIIIGHNVSYDLSMLFKEYSRMGYEIDKSKIRSFCTLSEARIHGIEPANLEYCCEIFGIKMLGAHHALADAKATYELAQEFGLFNNLIDLNVLANQKFPEIGVIQTHQFSRIMLPKTKKKGMFDAVNEDKFSKTKFEDYSIEADSKEWFYMNELESAIEDRHISFNQQSSLSDIQAHLQLTEAEIKEIKILFLRGLIGSMLDDEQIDDHEKADLCIVINELGLNESDLNYAKENPINLELVNEYYRLNEGDKVVFTGTLSVDRKLWKARAETVGLKVSGAVSAKTNFLVVPLIITGSGKSKAARKKGVHVVSEQRFIRMIKRLESSQKS